MRTRIIVIGGGDHHNALGVIRSLGERGYEVELITVGSLRKHYISSSRYVTKHYALDDIKKLSAYLLYRRSHSDEKEVIISCSDKVTEHLNQFQDSLKTRYYIPGVESQGHMTVIMDKTYMMEIAQKNDISSPTTWNIPGECDRIKYPCITKSCVSSHGTKNDIIVCQNREQLDRVIAESKGEIFAQSYIDKKEEVQFIGCSLRSGEEVIVPGMSTICRSQPNTNTGLLKYGPITDFYSDTLLKVQHVLRNFGYSGLFSFEILRDKNDQIWFMEVNFRNDGNAWCVYKSGVNLPVLWVKACLGEDYIDELKVPNYILMMPEFQDFKLVLQRKISLTEWIKDWRRTDYFMEYDSHDKRPFFQYIIDKIR